MPAEISPEAEAVARTLCDLYQTAGEEPEVPWRDVGEAEQEEWRGDARVILAAALPAIRAQLLDEFSERLLGDEAVEAVRGVVGWVHEYEGILPTPAEARDALHAALETLKDPS
jgi:hypothetical protein